MELVLILVTFLCFIVFISRTRESSIPGPWGFPVFGYLPFLNVKAPYKKLLSLSLKYGPIFQMRLGLLNTVVLTDIKLIREALKRDEFIGRAPLYITHGIMGGYGLIGAEGAIWHDQRRKTIDWLKSLGMAKFGTSRGILEGKIKTGVVEFLNVIRKTSIENPEINPMPALHHSLGNIINDLVFGVIYNEDNPTWTYLQTLQEEGVKLIGISSVVNFLPFLRFLPQNKKTIEFLLDGKRRTHAIYDDIIANCWATLKDKKDIAYKPRNVLEHFLLERQARISVNDSSALIYSEEQLRHLLADLFGAGVDTTITTLRWFLLYMAKNPSFQSILREKLSAFKISELSLADLEKCDFLRACIAETQRIRSVVPLGIPHGTVKDTTLAGYKIKKNTMVIPLQWAVHMNPKIWPNPEIYNPFRFLTDDDKFFTPQEFIPFQTGKRICLGEEMAKILLYLFCGLIIHNFEISISPSEEADMEGDCGITLTPPDISLTFKEVK